MTIEKFKKLIETSLTLQRFLNSKSKNPNINVKEEDERFKNYTSS